MAERKPVVVIYDDENVLECLTQELISAATAALLAGEFECEQNATLKFFKSENYSVRMSYGQHIGLNLMLNENIAVTDDVREYMQRVDTQAKNAEIKLLKERIEQLEKEVQ